MPQEHVGTRFNTFLQKAREVHNGRYDYSLVAYKDAHTNITIVCPEHGPFETTPNNHKRGWGPCPTCHSQRNSVALRSNTTDFTAKAKRMHGDRYEYRTTKYVDSRTGVEILCKTHGYFTQVASVHLSGHGCPKCAADEARIRGRSSTQQFINSAKAIHGDRYSYELVAYINNSTKVEIRCRKHGIFRQTPSNHLANHGCPSCSSEKTDSFYSEGQRRFITSSEVLHSRRYDYTRVLYRGNKTKVKIGCPQHGFFEQTPNSHLAGVGCPRCGREKANTSLTMTKDEFIRAAEKTHGDTYGYQEVEYVNSKEKVRIFCKTHGAFTQLPAGHIRGGGCPLCARKFTAEGNRYDTQTFTELAMALHKGAYDYSMVDYVDNTTKVQILCVRHGVFEQTPQNHLQGKGCAKCANILGTSKGEVELSDFVETLGAVERSDRTIIPPLEIDCVVPGAKLGVEYCGNYFHSDKFKEDRYHADKLIRAIEAGYDLVQVFEDEWQNKKHIVKSILKNKLGASERKVFARKTEIRQVDIKDSRAFLEDNHLQGYVHAEVSLGLYYKDELVMLASFSSNRKIIKGLDEGWLELMRLCTRVETTVVGGFSKLLTSAIGAYQPKGIKTFCDLRYFNGAGYEAVGFVKSHDSKPNYFYLASGKDKRLSRHAFQKHKLSKKLGTFDPAKTERENLRDNGYLRIYDCGNRVLKLYL